MPSRLRDTERTRVSSRRDADKGDKSESRTKHKSSTRRRSSKKEHDNTEGISAADMKSRSSLPARIGDDDGDEPVTPTGLDSKSSLPYPSFSKAHSKEAVGSREALRPLLNIFTPDPTDLDAVQIKRCSRAATVGEAPPSPPLTSVDNNGDPSTLESAMPTVEEEPEKKIRSEEPEKKSRLEKTVKVEKPAKEESTLMAKLRSKTSLSSKRSTSELASPKSPVRSRQGTPVKIKVEQEPRRHSSHGKTKGDRDRDRDRDRDLRQSSSVKEKGESRRGTPVRVKVERDSSETKKTTSESEPRRSTNRSIKPDSASPSPALAAETQAATSLSSNATSIAPTQPATQRPGSRPLVVDDDAISLVTSIPDGLSRGPTPMDALIVDDSSPYIGQDHPPPPPPPPVALSQPKVDYLLQYGGLGNPVSKTFLSAGGTMPHQSIASPASMVTNIFEPYSQLLDNFQLVVSKNGSLAAATGYRSVARRLLDRLEAVFARDISSEECACFMCTSVGVVTEDGEGVSWGEILELVSGRRDLPSWPPFFLGSYPQGLGISDETHIPMQKMDIDVPEEYREHYLRQSRKTKQSVDKWLSRQTEDPSGPPEEMDDETLAFTILTHLSYDQRRVYRDLLGIPVVSAEPPKRMPSPQRGELPPPTPTPPPRARPEAIEIASRAVQRLYRLALPPRDPEVALYLLNTPSIHNALATLAAVSDDEWEILTSGRFDGFLRSGADDVEAPLPDQQIPRRSVSSRGPTPLHNLNPSHLSRTQTPASSAHYGAPIAYDEETEIATLAEIERDIYSGMEALEDAFEALHVKAEAVRQALRERGAGLASMQQRRRGGQSAIEVRMGTPAAGLQKGEGRWETETEISWDRDWDGISEIAPDDSASNISSSRRRRPKRRTERRTPAPVEEGDEEYAASEGTASPVKR